MSTFQYKGQGLRSVGAYQASGHPYITGSSNLDDEKVHMIEFPYVSKSFTVINNNTSGDIRVHFQSGSATPVTVPGGLGQKTIKDEDDVIANFHHITVPAGYGSVTFDVKCKKFYISQNVGSEANMTYQVYAELTGIPSGSMYHLTGSGITS